MRRRTMQEGGKLSHISTSAYPEKGKTSIPDTAPWNQHLFHSRLSQDNPESQLPAGTWLNLKRMGGGWSHTEQPLP